MTLRESIAEYAHESWASWTEYMLSKCIRNPDGTMTIPQYNVNRWIRQYQTPYSALSEKEKESDLVEADNIFRTIEEEGYEVVKCRTGE